MQCETVRDELASGYLQWEDGHYLQVARHLESCAECRAQRETVRALLALLQSGDPAHALKAPAPTRRKRQRTGLLLAAAAVLCAAVSGYFLGQRAPRGTPQAEPAPMAGVQPEVQPQREPVPGPAESSAEPVLASVPLLRLDAKNLRALRVREFVLQAQVALALRLLEPEQQREQREQRELVAEGWSLAAACEQAGERDLAQLLGATSYTLEGPGEARQDRQALADLGRLRLGISSRGPQTSRDDIL